MTKRAKNGELYDPVLDGLFNGGDYAISDAGDIGIDRAGNIYAGKGVSQTDKQLLKLKWQYENDPKNREKYAAAARDLRMMRLDDTITADKPLSYYQMKTGDTNASNSAVQMRDAISNAGKSDGKYHAVLDHPNREKEKLLYATPDYNYHYNKDYKISGYINGQGLGDVAKMRYGLRNMEDNGCEIIAMYNALQTLGNPHELRDVANWGEQNALWQGGIWGTKPGKIPAFFEKLGYQVNRVNKVENYDEAVKIAKTSIFVFWNNKDKRPFEGIHTVAVDSMPDGTSKVYNRSNKDEKVNYYNNFEEMITKGNIRPKVLYCIDE